MSDLFAPIDMSFERARVSALKRAVCQIVEGDVELAVSMLAVGAGIARPRPYFGSPFAFGGLDFEEWVACDNAGSCAAKPYGFKSGAGAAYERGFNRQLREVLAGRCKPSHSDPAFDPELMARAVAIGVEP